MTSLHNGNYLTLNPQFKVPGTFPLRVMLLVAGGGAVLFTSRVMLVASEINVSGAWVLSATPGVI